MSAYRPRRFVIVYPCDDGERALCAASHTTMEDAVRDQPLHPDSRIVASAMDVPPGMFVTIDAGRYEPKPQWPVGDR